MERNTVDVRPSTGSLLNPSAVADDVLVNTKHLAVDPHRIDFRQFIASGAFCSVFQAVLNSSLGEQQFVAVKKLRAVTTVRIRLAREIRIWVDLKHQNVLPLLGYYWGADDDAWLISPFCVNNNFRAYAKCNQLHLEMRLELLLDTARGLQYLHERSPPVIHGDLKSDNVVISSSHRAMLCDFGLTQILKAPGASTGLTTSRSEHGTVRYYSPELAYPAEEMQFGPTLKSDVWAWGCLALEMAVDITPFRNCNHDGQIYMQLNQRQLPAAIDSIPLSLQLRRLIGSCWDLDPEKRPQMSEAYAFLSSVCAANPDSHMNPTADADRKFNDLKPPSLIPRNCHPAVLEADKFDFLPSLPGSYSPSLEPDQADTDISPSTQSQPLPGMHRDRLLTHKISIKTPVSRQYAFDSVSEEQNERAQFRPPEEASVPECLSIERARSNDDRRQSVGKGAFPAIGDDACPKLDAGKPVDELAQGSGDGQVPAVTVGYALTLSPAFALESLSSCSRASSVVSSIKSIFHRNGLTSSLQLSSVISPASERLPTSQKVKKSLRSGVSHFGSKLGRSSPCLRRSDAR